MLVVLILVALWSSYMCQCFLLVALCLGLGGMVGGIVPWCQCCLLLVYASHCAPLGLLGHYWALGSSSLPTQHTFYYYLLSCSCATAGQDHLICFVIYACNYDSQLLWKPIRFPPPKKYTPLTSLNYRATWLLLGKSIKYSYVVIYAFDYSNTPHCISFVHAHGKVHIDIITSHLC